VDFGLMIQLLKGPEHGIFNVQTGEFFFITTGHYNDTYKEKIKYIGYFNGIFMFRPGNNCR
jgi:hypothetical protein